MALTPLDFPASPTVGTLYPDPPVTGQPTYRWDGAQWLSYAAASLPTPTKPANYGKKNYIINGAMMVSQENGLAPGTGSGYYPVDQFSMLFSNAGTQTAVQVFTFTPGGSTARLRVTATAADATVAAGDFCEVIQVIEGNRFADLKFGTPQAKAVTVQFGVKAPAGTYTVSLLNALVNRSYAAEYTIAAGEANTDVIKSVTIPGCPDGTWGYDNGFGVVVRWGLMAGATFQQVAGSWGTGNVIGSSNQFNFMGTINNVFELFDVSLTEGSVAPPFQVPDYASELDLCRRYWRKLGGQVVNDMYIAGYGTSSGVVAITMPLAPPMRAGPTLAIASAFTNVNVATISHALSPGSVAWLITPSAVGQMTYAGGSYNLNARL